MKSKFASRFMAGMLITASSINALAQENGVISIIGGQNRPATGQVLQGPGAYEVTTYDRNQLERIATDHFSANQAEDKQFLLDTVRLIEGELNKINDFNMGPGGFFELYNKSMSGTIDVVAYATAQQRLQSQLNQTQAAVNGILLIPSAIKSPEEVQVREQVIARLPSKLKVDLEKIQGFYTNQLKAMISQVSGLNFKIRLANNVIESVTGVSFTPPANAIDYKFLEQERISAMRDATIDLSQSEILNDMNRHNLALIRSNIKAFGTSQRYRFNLNAEGRDRNLQNLAEAFWVRDMLRANFGFKFGAITVDYTKRMINWDFFASSNKLDFMGEFLTSDSDLIEYSDKLNNALVTMEARDKEVFGEGVDLLARIMSGVTFVKGESQLASVNVVVLRLLQHDIEQEQLLGKPGGLKAVRENYRKTYYTSAEQEQVVKERARAYTAMLDTSSEGIEDDMMIIGQGSDLKGEFIKSVQALETLVDKVNQAKTRLAAIEKLRGDNKSRDNVRKRMGDL